MFIISHHHKFCIKRWYNTYEIREVLSGHHFVFFCFQQVLALEQLVREEESLDDDWRYTRSWWRV